LTEDFFAQYSALRDFVWSVTGFLRWRCFRPGKAAAASSATQLLLAEESAWRKFLEELAPFLHW
jgi:hypothetical protein